MKNIKGRAIRVIKRLSVESTKKAPTRVAPVVVTRDSNDATASMVGNWILERQANRLAESVFSSNKILSWKGI